MSEFKINDSKNENAEGFCPFLSNQEKLVSCRNDCMLFCYENTMCPITLIAFSMESLLQLLSKALKVDLE